MNILTLIVLIMIGIVVTIYFVQAFRQPAKNGNEISDVPLRSILTFNHSKPVG